MLSMFSKAGQTRFFGSRHPAGSLFVNFEKNFLYVFYYKIGRVDFFKKLKIFFMFFCIFERSYKIFIIKNKNKNRDPGSILNFSVTRTEKSSLCGLRVSSI
jgi:hypothetical protein